MGPKHPISLRLKKHKLWNKTLYGFNSSVILNLTKEYINLIRLTNYYFQYLIISTPKIYYENNILKIKVYYFIKPSLSQHSVKSFLQDGFILIKFEHLLQQIYKKTS